MPPLSARAQRALATLLAAAALAFLLAQHLFYAALPADDAFLHLRVAENLAQHGEPTYNLGEAVCATSSPLWLVLLAGGSALGCAALPFAVGLAALALGALYLALLALFARELRAAAAALAAFLVVALTASTPSALLMESALALALWCRSATALRDERPRAVGVWGSLALATRFEMALWLAVALLAARGARAKLQVALGAAPGLLALAAWMLGWYGDLVPASARAKAIVYELGFDEGLASLAIGLGPWWPVVTAALALALLLRVAPMQRASAAMLGFGVLVAFAYASQRTLIFPWYRPLYLLPLLGGGLLSLASAPPATRALALLFLGLCGTRASAEALSMTSGFLTRTRAAWSEHASGLRVQRYLRLGASLRERFPNASVLAPEIGALGWSFRGRILDGLGLATPAALAFHPLPVPSMRTHGSEGALPPEAIARFQPDLIVSLDVFGTAARRALQSGELRGYREIETVPALCGIDGAEVSEHVRLWEARETWVYVREGLASSIHTGQ